MPFPPYIENVFNDYRQVNSQGMKNDDIEKNDGLLNEEQKKKFEQFAKDAKSLGNEINKMISEFEKKNNVGCWISVENSNHIIIEISTDIENL